MDLRLIKILLGMNLATMKRFDIGLAAAAWLLLVTVALPADIETASAKINSLSVDLQPATEVGAPTVALNFTTPDRSGFPQYQLANGVPLVSGDLVPSSTTPGLYQATWFPTENGAVPDYGYGTWKFPTTDADTNGVPDFLQLEMPGTASFSGTFYSELLGNPPSAFSGSIQRTAGSTNGTYTLSTGGASFTGKTYILQGSGALEYIREPTNSQCLLTLTVPNSQGAVATYSGTANFNASRTNVNNVNFPQFMSITATNNASLVLVPFTLSRVGNKYRGSVGIIDGNPLTTWADYQHWEIEIVDANDSDGNGVPDLSDIFVWLVIQDQKGANQAALTVLGRPGVTYQIQSSADLKTWMPGPAIILDNLGSGSVTNQYGLPTFYRAVMQ
jgi:hypothetical protein